MSEPSTAGADGFIAGLRRCGLDASVEAGIVSFTVEAVDGAHAGRQVRTGVGTQELSGWPLIPPHWVHLPADFGFARTNSQPSAIPGWLQHSRQIQHWGHASEPAQAWIAHVRGILGEAL